jgi:hypothetical protein
VLGGLLENVGASLGNLDGWEVGDALGKVDGWEVGDALGKVDGWEVGDALGKADGWEVGDVLGSSLGSKVGVGVTSLQVAGSQPQIDGKSVLTVLQAVSSSYSRFCMTQITRSRQLNEPSLSVAIWSITVLQLSPQPQSILHVPGLQPRPQVVGNSLLIIEQASCSDLPKFSILHMIRSRQLYEPEKSITI